MLSGNPLLGRCLIDQPYILDTDDFSAQYNTLLLGVHLLCSLNQILDH